MSLRIAVLSDLHLELGLPARARCSRCGAEIVSRRPGDGQRCPCRASAIKRAQRQTRPRLIGTAEPLPTELGYDATARAGQADAAVLAGDIHSGVRGVAWAAAEFAGLPVIYVAGNHEAYDHDLAALHRDLRAAAARTANVIVLENEAADLVLRGQPVRFLGCTLWSDFGLYGDARRAMARAAAGMNDFRLIRHAGQRWTPAAAAAAHAVSRAWLAAELGTVRAGTLAVVVTHHAPSRRSIAPPYDGDWLSPAFASNLDELIARHRPAAWIHGHTHDPAGYDLGHTAVVCHPRGYPHADPDWQWRPRIVEVG